MKIKDIIQTSLKWHGHVIRRDFNSQMREAMELEITGKRKTGRRKKSFEECPKEGFGTIWA